MTPDGRDDMQDALESLRWRDEILGVLYWLRGEDIMPSASAGDLGGFLVAEPDLLQRQLEFLAAAGYLLREDVDIDSKPRYRLSDQGAQEGGRIFADDFAELTGAAHGECGPGCSCQRHGACAVPVG